MSESPKKQSFLHGAALLAAATAVVKIIGALYKIPLNAIIGEQGFSYFYTAYEIYSVLLLISTAGLPVAVSRLISQANSLGHYNQVRQVYKTARNIFLLLGLVSSLLMTIFCRRLAEFQQQPDAWFAIGCLGPCALLVCLLSAFRGFFQGQGNMIPTSVSEVLEAFFKMVVGIAAAVLLLQATNSVPYAAGGAILGVTVSCLVSAVYLYAKFRKSYRSLPASGEQVWPASATAKALLAIAVPITIGSAGLQLLSVLEAKLYMTQLLNLGNTQEQADTMKGIYNMTQTIFNMPCAFIPAITISIIPAITAHITLMNNRAACATEESAARITGLISLPCAVGLFLLAEPIVALIGGYRGEKLTLATHLMALMGIGTFFYSIVQLTNAIMQAHGHATIPVVNMLLAGVMRLVIVYLLTGNPHIALLGAPIGAALCYLCIGILNLVAMRRVIPQQPAIARNMLRPLIPALIMGAAAFGSWIGLKRVFAGTTTSGKLILCAVPVLVGVVVYAFLAVKFHAITREDCLLLPKGDKIAKFLHL